MANEIHDPILVGNALVTQTPTEQEHIVNKRYVDKAGGILYISAVEPVSSGSVGVFVYTDTNPAELIVEKCSSDTLFIRVHYTLYLTGDSFNPTVTAETTQNSAYAASINADMAVDRKYYGSVDLEIASSETVTLTADSGLTASLEIEYASTGPTFQTILIGAYPNSQTALKEGDLLPVTGVVPNVTESISVVDFGAATEGDSFTFGVDDSAGNQLKTFAGFLVISSLDGTLTARVVANNALGTPGTELESPTILLDQSAPLITGLNVSYPAGQNALKDSETVYIYALVSGYDTLDYTSGANLSIFEPLIYRETKEVTRIGGDIEEGVDNYTITATQASNGKQTVVNVQILIANVAPEGTISIVGDPTKLISTGSGEDYAITLAVTQPLYTPPAVSAPSGYFLDDPWTLVDGLWENTLRVTDSAPKGVFDFTGTLTGSSGLIGITLSNTTYEVGGFVVREITIPAFSREIAIGTSVNDISLLSAKIKGSTYNLILQATTDDVVDGFSISDGSGAYDPNGSFLYLNDPVSIASNSAGTLVVEISEAVQ